MFLVMIHLASALVNIEQGKVITPVTFGHIHIFLDPEDFKPSFVESGNMLEEVRKTNLTRLGHSELDKMLRFDRREVSRAERLHADLLAVFSLKDKEMVSNHTRHTRAAALIAAAVAMGATIVTTLGLAVANRVELEELTDTVEVMNDDMTKIITTLETNSVEVQYDVAALNRSMYSLSQGQQQTTEKMLLMDAWTKLKLYHDRVQRRLEIWLRAIYSAFQGHLDPALVSVDQLQEGMARVESYARGQGLHAAEFDSALEVLFTMPISIRSNSSGLHLFVHVPLLPVGMNTMILLKLEPTPLQLRPNLYLNLDVTGGLLLTDRLHKMHLEVSQAELSGCKSFRDHYFCQFDTFRRSPNTCLAAAMLRDKALVTALCRKTVSRRETHFVTLGERVLIRSTEDTLVRKECPTRPEAQAVYRFEGELNVTDLRGCTVLTDEYVHFARRRANSTVTLQATPTFAATDLLEGLSVEEVATTVDHVAGLRDLREVTLDFSEVLAHRVRRDHGDHLKMTHAARTMTHITLAIAGLAGILALGLTIGLMGRLGFLMWKKKENTGT